MTESIEHAVEQIGAAVLFCMAILLLLRLHSAWLQQTDGLGQMPERLILFERAEEEWKHWEEP